MSVVDVLALGWILCVNFSIQWPTERTAEHLFRYLLAATVFILLVHVTKRVLS